MKFAGRLQELRMKQGLSQRALAKKLGVSTSTISMYEQGKREPNIDFLSEIARYFSVSIDYLVGNSDVPSLHKFDVKMPDGGVISLYSVDATPPSPQEAAQAVKEMKESGYFEEVSFEFPPFESMKQFEDAVTKILDRKLAEKE